MKKVIKYFLVVVLLIVISVPLVFRHRIALYYNIYKEYTNYKEDISTISMENILTESTDLNKEKVIYKTTGNTNLPLDIYSPVNIPKKGSPVILYVHGGSWAYGSSIIPGMLSPLLKSFIDEGYTIISVSYELLNSKIDFKKQVCDVKDSIRWVYKNKDKYNFNTDEIGVIGVSAGAHLSLLACYSDSNDFTDDETLAAYSSEVKYIVDFFGPTDLNSLDQSIATEDITEALKTVQGNQEYIEKYSPINYVKKGIPKTLIIHSKSDSMVPYENSLNLYNKSKEFNNNVKLVTVNDMNHDLSNISQEDAKTIALNFLTFIINNSPR